MNIHFISNDIEEPMLLTTEDLKEHHVFRIAPSELKRMFYYENTYRYDKRYLPDQKISKSLSILKELGGPEEIIKSLTSDKDLGIIGDVKDLQRR